MKRCPQCNHVFEDTLDYCTEDGTALVDETFVLPSESLPDETEEETVINHQPITIDIPSVSTMPANSTNQIPVTEEVVPIIIEKRSNTGKYLLFLIVGLLLGGILVLILFQLRNSRETKTTENIQILNGKHNQPNKTRNESEFNGFVLSENANIRSSPTGDVLDVLPKNDRLSILERDGAWYRVMCEHGVTGWMHGNTIRFDDDANTF